MDPHRTVDEWREAGGALLRSGAPLLAYDTLAGGLAAFPFDARLRQLMALALARSGAARRASALLRTLVDEGHGDEETLALLARTHKDLAAHAVNERERIRELQLALQFYRDAHRASGGYYSGINAATLALIVGHAGEAARFAQAVRQQCTALLAREPHRADRYWLLATLGEAALVLRDTGEAERWYGEAAVEARQRPADLASTRRNARLILSHLGADGAAIDALLHVPSVLVFAGHLIDRPDRPVPRFPPALEASVRDAIARCVRATDVGFGYASAACGSDILFLEALDEIGAERHVVLPYDREQFRCDSVDVAGGDWGARYDRQLAAAAEVLIASEQRMTAGGMSFEYGLLMLDGAAGVRADELDTELRCLAVWDGRPGDGAGGTANAVARWRSLGWPVDVIDLAALLREQQIIVSASAERDLPAAGAGIGMSIKTSSRFTPEIVGLLFGDAHGFSKLTEDELPLFVEHFLGLAAEEIARAPRPPILLNTWGDGLYFVFRSVEETGEFALALSEAIGAVDWKAKGFHDDVSLRIGLHVGPAYRCIDPVTGRTNYIGAHVSHAARIEPIAPPGEVYASGAFAAIARAERVRAFSCSYVGQTPLAKSYGTFPTYVVHRRRPATPIA